LQKYLRFFKLGKIKAYPVPNKTQFYDHLGSILYPGRNVFNRTSHKKKDVPSTKSRIKTVRDAVFTRPNNV